LAGPLAFAVAVLMAWASAAAAGTLAGQVRISELVLGQPRDSDDQSNAVIFVSGFQAAPAGGRQLELAQENKSFHKRVLAITQGEAVTFPNLDKIHHNVWSQSKPKSFDLGLYKFPEVRSVTFERPGIVTVFCNIHPQMISTILVLPNNQYAVTDKSGAFRIENVPDGELPVYAWVEGATPAKQMAVFRPGETVTLEFKLTSQRIPVRHLNKEGKPYREDY
jgi:plastocyanin